MLEVIVTRSSLTKHKPWFDHPENPGRVVKILDTLKRMGSVPYRVWSDVTDAGEAVDVASMVHSRDYVERLVDISRRGSALLDGDTYIASDSLELALESFLLSYRFAGELRGVSFLVIRPPGHHAGKRGRTKGVSSNGFCLLNNAAAGVLGFRHRGFKNIAILDFDVHHGNGTMEIFYRERLLHIDLHQHPDTLYPYTGYPDEIGEGEGFGFKANFVFQPYTGDDSYMAALDYVGDLLSRYQPDALVVSAGFDGYAGDGLADLSLSEASYYRLGRLVRDLAVPTLVVLEGGYTRGLEGGFRAFVEGLAGLDRSYTPTTSPRGVARFNEQVNRGVYEQLAKRVG